MDRGSWRATVHEVHRESDTHTHTHTHSLQRLSDFSNEEAVEVNELSQNPEAKGQLSSTWLF